MSFKIVVSCVKHPRYQAIQPPRIDCDDCRKMYELRTEVRHRAGLPNKGSGYPRHNRGTLADLQPRDFCAGTVIRPYLIKGLG